MNTIRVIKNEGDHKAALSRLEALMDATPGSPEERELDLLSYLIDKYEEEHFPIDLPDPVEAIKFRMEQQGLTRKDLIPYIGSQSKVSEVLNHKRTLSLSMIRSLHEGLGIPAEVLLQEPGKQLAERRYNPEDYPLKDMHTAGYFPGYKSLRNVKEHAEELLEGLFSPLDAHPEQIVYCRNTGFTINHDTVINTAVADHHTTYSASIDTPAKENIKTEKQNREMNENALRAWQARVLEICESQDMPIFEKQSLTKEFMRHIVRLSVFPNGPLLAKQVLINSGIYFVVLPHLPQTYLDGACFNTPSGRFVVCMTIRHDRLDNFWFTLAHELSHLLLHLKKDNFAFFDDTEHGLRNPCNQQEVEANRLSMDLFIPSEIWEVEKEKLMETMDEHNVITLAQKLSISPAIVVGRLRWEKDNYTIFNNLIGVGSVRKLFPEFAR